MDNKDLVAVFGKKNGNTPSGSGLTDAVKQALIQCFNDVVWEDADGTGAADIAALQDALYPNQSVQSIDAVFNQGSAIIMTTDTLEDLRQYLTVTATLADGSTEVVTGYSLSGSLTEGEDTITVTYQQKTDTFTVVVTGWILDLSGSDMVKGTVQKTAPNYYNSNNSRVSYVGTAFETSSAYKYKVYALECKTGYTLQIAFYIMDATNAAKAKNGEDISNWTDSGWKSVGATITAPDNGLVFFATKSDEVNMDKSKVRVVITREVIS